MGDNFFNIYSDQEYWITDFNGTLDQYSSINNKIFGLEYHLELKKKIFQNYNCYYQIFQTNWILSHEHLSQIFKLIFEVFQKNMNISKKMDVEFLLYLSAQRQISSAIEILGVKFPLNPEDSLNFSQILFGNETEIKNAVKFLREQVNEAIYPVNFAEVNSDREYIDYIKKFDINSNTIDHQINFRSISSHISSQERKSFLLDALSQKMAKLYLQNFKN